MERKEAHTGNCWPTRLPKTCGELQAQGGTLSQKKPVRKQLRKIPNANVWPPYTLCACISMHTQSFWEYCCYFGTCGHSCRIISPPSFPLFIYSLIFTSGQQFPLCPLPQHLLQLPLPLRSEQNNLSRDLNQICHKKAVHSLCIYSVHYLKF